MASTSQVQSDAHAALQSPQLQQAPAQLTDAVVPDAHPPEGETVQERLNLPDICKLEWQRDGMPDTEFYRKYPPDPWGEEASPNARVWKIYRDQQDLSHNRMLDGWNKTLDVLLIFAGLFSAVLTAFLIESYKSLQPDYTQYVAAFLYAAAVSHKGTGSIFPALEMIVAPDRFIQTSSAQRWTNGLWFSSLVISLAVALLCILIKQWLDAYHSHVSSEASSPRHWARRHSLYHHGLDKWGVPALISFLPLLLHLSLFLFFVGLVLFLRPLDGAISYSLLVMVSCIGAFYILALFLPAWRVECPSYTPLLAHAQLAVARVTLTLRYIIRAREWLELLTGELPYALSVHLGRAERWIESLELRAMERHTYETRTIVKCSPELDGHVLSTLIQLPIDSNRDIITAAYGAFPAVGSFGRAIDVISREVPSHALSGKLIDCDRSTPWTVCGFTITLHEQLRRAHEATRLPEAWIYWDHRRLSIIPGGLDRLLSQALGIINAAGNQRSIDLLIRQLQALSSCEDGSPELPPHSACLVYLELYPKCGDFHPQGLSCFLLLFCAGRFARADTQDLMRALRSIRLVLTRLVLSRQCSIDLPADDAGNRDYIIGMANSLWLILSESPRYSIDTVTAQIVSSQTFAFFDRFFDFDHVVWGQISGLSAFVRSPTFFPCVMREDRSPIFMQYVDTDSGLMHCSESLHKYMTPFRFSGIVDRASVQLEDYWECISTLSKLSEDALVFSSASELFPVEPLHWNCVDRLSNGGPYPTQDDWYEPALAAFLVGPNAITTWTFARPRFNANLRIQNLGDLAHRISIVLCRRQRLCRPNDSFVSAFFSGPFLLKCFQDRVSLRPPRPRRERFGFSDEDAVDDIARHCLKLSPEGFMALLTQLEETGDEGSALRAAAVAFAQRIRTDSAPGGPLSAECAAYCACMLPAARAPTSTPTRWEALVAQFRRGRAEPATATNV